GPDDVVGVLTERSVELVVTLLAVLKAGAAYLPLDAHAPRLRHAQLLNAAHARLVIGHRRFVESLATEGRVVTSLEDAAAAIDGEEPGPLAPIVDGRHLAYVLYTSGSTGMPKGVMIEHRGLAAYVAGVTRE